MNYEALKNVFGSESTEKIKKLMEQQETLSWSERQILTLCEGYPSDTSTKAFAEADEFNTQGWDCHTAGQYGDALKYYQKALELCPDFPMVWNNKGLAHFRLGQFELANEACQEAIRLNPLFIKPYSNLGILHCELRKDTKEAISWFKKALALDPNYQRARAYLDQLQDEPEHVDVLMIGADPELSEGIIKAFQEKGKKVGIIRS